jgi:subtilisin family serine protease
LGIASAGQDANTPGVFPNDPYFPNQWHLHNTGQSGGTPGADIRAPQAWAITTGDPNIVVAVVDSGVDSKHPDLVDNLVPGYDFMEGDSQPDPALSYYRNAHGTACAGLIAAQGNNTVGVTGVTWSCKIMPIRIWWQSDDETSYWITEADSATAFRWTANKGADVLSNSWTFGTTPTPIFQSAIADVTRTGGIGRGGKGCIVLFCAGNDSGPLPYPDRYPEVISVGATDHNDVRCYYSNYGPELDLVAPSSMGRGESELINTGGRGWLWTTDISGPAGFDTRPGSPYPDVLDYTVFSGTSGACPIAAGVAALILSIEPNLTSEEVRDFMTRSAKDLGDAGRDDYYGYGRVDARAALDLVLAKRCDLNNDLRVDERDLAIVKTAIDANDLSADIAPPAKRDGVVDANDLELVTRYLGTVMAELGLIAHWKLDETAGAVAHDSAGEHRDATVTGNPLWQPGGGKLGGALQLSGVPNSLMTKLARDPAKGPMSVLAWVKGGAAGQVIISQGGGANWLMARTPDGTLMTNLKSAGGQTLTSPALITDGNWHQVGLAWDGSNRILYVDGVEVKRDTQDSLAGSTGNLTIGAGSTMAPTSFWKGLIDDVRIYDRAVKP